LHGLRRALVRPQRQHLHLQRPGHARRRRLAAQEPERQGPGSQSRLRPVQGCRQPGAMGHPAQLRRLRRGGDRAVGLGLRRRRAQRPGDGAGHIGPAPALLCRGRLDPRQPVRDPGAVAAAGRRRGAAPAFA
ncbi:hypothetical protein LTR94_031699, partial [Friedmanniomyces endolithicus]